MNAPSADPPFYFIRRWDPAGDRTGLIEIGGDLIGVVFASDPLVIYGRKVSSPYPEDRVMIAASEKRGLIWTESFSVACPDGELGSQPLADCEEITEAEFEMAKERGWS